MTQAFNLSQLANFVNTSGQLNAATGLYNQVPVANGGTGKSSVTSGALLLGAGTSAMTELTGTTANTLVVSSPAGWTSAPIISVAGGDYVLQQYTTPASWTKPATIKAIKVTVIGGGGSGGSGTGGPGIPSPSPSTGGSGGGGGGAIWYLDAPGLPASPIAITAGPGTNSFGPFVSATAGGNGTNASSGTPGGNGSGGTGTGGTINFTGSSGTLQKIGGSSALGFGVSRFQAGAINQAGLPGIAYGGGGTGGTGPTTQAGGTGSSGIVIVEEFY